MANTAEEVKKNVMDASTQAAIAALEKQVEDTRKAYANMNRNAEIYAQQGRVDLQNRMETAGVQQPVSSTAGVIMDVAAGEAKNRNAQHQQLNLQRAQNNIQYLQNAGQERAVKLQQQAAQQKAENLARYGDFSGYGELGYSPEQIQGMKTAYDAENNKVEDYAGLGKYAQTLLDLYAGNEAYDIESNLKEAMQNGLISAQDYQAAMIAARGIVPGSKGKKQTGSGTDTPKANPLYDAAQAALNRVQVFENGKGVITDPEDWAALAAYYNAGGLDINDNFIFREEKIYVPGYGNISYATAEQLERQGKIIMTGVDNAGDPIYSTPVIKNPGQVNMRY